MYEEYIEELKKLASKADPNIDRFKYVHDDINKYKERLQRFSRMNFREKHDDEVRKDVSVLSMRLAQVIKKHDKVFGRSQAEFDAMEVLGTLMLKINNLEAIVRARFDIPPFLTEVANLKDHIHRGGFTRAFRVLSRDYVVPTGMSEEDFVGKMVDKYNKTLDDYKKATPLKIDEMKKRFVDARFFPMLESADKIAIRYHPNFETKDVKPEIEKGKAKTMEKYLSGEIDKVRVREIVKEYENLIAKKWMEIDDYKYHPGKYNANKEVSE